MMTLAIPVIATMIVAGGAQALTHMTSTVMGPAQSSAQTAGAAAGAGNVGFANATWDTASWDNRNAHSWSLSRSTTSPSRSTFTDVAGTVETGTGGHGPVFTTNQGRGVVTPQMMASAGHEWSRQADRFTQLGQTQSLQAQESWRAATQSAISYVRDNSSYSRETGSYTWQDGSRMTTQQQTVARSIDTLANELALTDVSSASRAYQASFGADPGSILKAIRLSGGVSLRNTSDEQIADAVRKVQQISRDAGLTDERAVVHAAMAGGGFETGAQGSRRGASDLRASHDTAVAYERQAQTSFSEGAALRNAAAVVTREGFSITGDDTFAIHRRAAEEGVSRAAMNDPSVMMDVARRYFLDRYGVSVGERLDGPNPQGPPPEMEQMKTPKFSDGSDASAEYIQREALNAKSRVSILNRAEGVAEQGAPTLHDVAEHFVDTKRDAQIEIGRRERGISDDEGALRSERERRYEDKSFFNDANPGSK